MHQVGYTLGVYNKVFETYVLDTDVYENILFQKNGRYFWFKEGFEFLNLNEYDVSKLLIQKIDSEGYITNEKEFLLENISIDDLLLEYNPDPNTESFLFDDNNFIKYRINYIYENGIMLTKYDNIAIYNDKVFVRKYDQNIDNKIYVINEKYAYKLLVTIDPFYVYQDENYEGDLTISHKHLICEKCGKCTNIKCDGEEQEKCQCYIIVNLVDKTYVSFINVDDYELQTNYIIINSYDEYINFVIDNLLMEIQFGPSNGLYYTDEFYSIINNYDEEFFEQNSLIFCYMDKLHSRINPRMVYQVELENGILKIHETLSGDDCPPNFKGKIFYNIEISKNVINTNLKIEFIGDKIIIIR